MHYRLFLLSLVNFTIRENQPDHRPQVYSPIDML